MQKQINPIKTLSNVISASVPAITTHLINNYNELLSELKSQHLALKRITTARTNDETKGVAAAISNEATAPAKTVAGLINKSIDLNIDKKEAEIAYRKAKNLQGEKSMSFSNAPVTNIKKKHKKRKAKSTPTGKKQNNTAETNTIKKRQTQQSNASRTKKRRSNDHSTCNQPNNNQPNNNQSTTSNKNNISNKKKQKKTFKSKKWVCPKGVDCQDESPKEA